MPAATLTSKGQITIPVEVRRKLGLRPGDRVDFVIERAREVVLRLKKAPLTSLFGILRRHRGKAASVEEMQESIVSSAKTGTGFAPEMTNARRRHERTGAHGPSR